MIELPEPLLRQLTDDGVRELRHALQIVAEELPVVYDGLVRDHRPHDNAQVFGLRGWVHVWAALMERKEELAPAEVIEANNTFYLRVAGLKVGIHKLGDVLQDDIHSCFPEGSPTQRGYGERNANQLTLFDREPSSPLPEERRYALRELIVGHFGNPKDGLVKWYIGAYVYDAHGRPQWAWVVAQDVEATSGRPDPTTPYSERPPAPLEVKPRSRADERRASEGTKGA